MKKLIYLMDIRLPNNFAHSIQVVKMCQAFNQRGLQVELVLPLRWQLPELRDKDIWDFYGVRRKAFKIVKLPCFDLFYLSRTQNIWFLRLRAFLATTSFYFFVFLYLLFKKYDILFTREYEGALVGRVIKFFKNIKVIFEVHVFPWHKYEKLLIFHGVRYLDMTIFLNKFLKSKFKQNKWLTKKTKVLPSGVDNKWITKKFSRLQARKRLGLPEKDKLIIYCGQFFIWKGVDVLIKSKKYLPKKWKIILVGGLKQDLRRTRRLVNLLKLSGITLIGREKHSKIFFYLKAADILVLPNSVKSALNSETSPLKFFEYMAAERPIVSSNLLSIKEVLKNKSDSIIFFSSDKPYNLAQAIKKVINNPKLARKIAQKSWKNARQFTWQKRARKILKNL